MEAQKILTSALKIYNLYNPIVDSYLSDFFVDKRWLKVNPAWWELLSNLDPDELASLLSLKTWKSKSVWPLSLLAFRTTIHSLSLNRNFSEEIDEDEDSLAARIKSDVKLSKTQAGQHIHELEHCFRRSVKPKKQHEILKLSSAIYNLCQMCNCNNILDVGAGQGHLSRLLAFKYGVHATAIEAVGFHNPKAEKLDNRANRDIVKASVKLRDANQDIIEGIDRSPLQCVFPNHVTATVNPNTSVNEFLGVVNYHLSKKQNNDISNFYKNINEEYIFKNQCQCSSHGGETTLNEKDKVIYSSALQTNSGLETKLCDKYIMTGLHACGDLTATMLKMFVQSSNLCGLASVACCYMKLTTCSSSDQEKSIGYPMSEFVNSIKNNYLSYEALEMACHFVDAYHKRLLDKDTSHLQVHCYRAALQEIILQKDPSFQRGCVKATVKNSKELSFEEYAHKALKKLGLDPTITKHQLEQTSEYLKEWKKVVAFYTLRLSLSPLIETIVLLDRVLFLHEHRIRSELVPIFDPILSPRNLLLVASKNK